MGELQGLFFWGFLLIFGIAMYVVVPKSEDEAGFFHLAFWTGISLGVLQALNLIPLSWAIGSGKYGVLLGTNLYGLALCTAGFFLPLALQRYRVASVGSAA